MSPFILLIAGRTCSGKTFLANHLMNHHGFQRVITYTSRTPRPGEVNGVDYHFKSEEEFEALINQGQFIEHVQRLDAATNRQAYYGSSLQHCLTQKQQFVMVIDPDGVRDSLEYLKKHGHPHCAVFLDTPESVCVDRLKERPSDPSETAQRLHDLTHIEREWHKAAAYNVIVTGADCLDIENLSHQLSRRTKKHDKSPLTPQP
ncbi:guanylate kinase [Vibrio splendidus]